MINHEVIVWVACAVTAALGYALGRMQPRDIEAPRPRPPAPKMKEAVEAAHPYRDSAAPSVAGDAPKKKSRLFRYCTHDQKHVYLSCPACQGRVDNMPVCMCPDVNSDPNVHFHTKCTNCGLRFAMETAAGAAERKRREKEEAEAKAAEKTEPKAN